MKITDKIVLSVFMERIIDKEQMDFITKIFSLSVFADNTVNALQLTNAKQKINDYIDTYYFMLKDKFKRILGEQIYDGILLELEQMKKDVEYWQELKEEIIFKIKIMKKRKKSHAFLKHILDSTREILKSDKIFTMEEQIFFKELRKAIEKN